MKSNVTAIVADHPRGRNKWRGKGKAAIGLGDGDRDNLFNDGPIILGA